VTAFLIGAIMLYFMDGFFYGENWVHGLILSWKFKYL
jgi:hypothetical protein